MPFSGSALVGFSIRPDHQELARSNARARRESPLRQIRVGTSKENPRKVYHVRAAVMNFHPRIIIARRVAKSCAHRRDLVQIDLRERLDTLTNRLWRTLRRVET